MQTQKTGLDFKGQNIFVGIDVHLKSWAVTILTENLVHKTFTQPACADTLSNYLKSFLHFYGISIPAEFEKSGTHWSKRFMKWLNQGVSLQHDSGTQTLRILVQEAEQQRKLLLEVLRKIRVLSRSKKYATNPIPKFNLNYSIR